MSDPDFDRRECDRGWLGPRFRAQSEPLAALVAVTLVCSAISLYVGVLGDVSVASAADRDVVEPTADAIREDLSASGAIDAETPIEKELDRGSLPQGYAVSVAVLVVAEDGTLRETGEATFDATGTLTTDPVPEHAERTVRPVPIRVRAGDVRPGRLVVEVWE